MNITNTQSRVCLRVFRKCIGIHTTLIATSSSVRGIANQIEFAPVIIGSSKIKIPLIINPRDMETTKAAFGFITAWK